MEWIGAAVIVGLAALPFVAMLAVERIEQKYHTDIMRLNGDYVEEGCQRALDLIEAGNPELARIPLEYMQKQARSWVDTQPDAL